MDFEITHSFDASPDEVAEAMLDENYQHSLADVGQLKERELIEQKIDEGYIRKVKGNSYMEDLTSGNAVAGITWSGDIFVLAYDTEDPNWTFTLPESLWLHSEGFGDLLCAYPTADRGAIRKLAELSAGEPDDAALVGARADRRDRAAAGGGRAG